MEFDRARSLAIWPRWEQTYTEGKGIPFSRRPAMTRIHPFQMNLWQYEPPLRDYVCNSDSLEYNVRRYKLQTEQLTWIYLCRWAKVYKCVVCMLDLTVLRATSSALIRQDTEAKGLQGLR